LRFALNKERKVNIPDIIWQNYHWFLWQFIEWRWHPKTNSWCQFRGAIKKISKASGRGQEKRKLMDFLALGVDPMSCKHLMVFTRVRANQFDRIFVFFFYVHRVKDGKFDVAGGIRTLGLLSHSRDFP
jgi:hypothetical protein